MKFDRKRAQGHYIYTPPDPPHKCSPPAEWQRREDRVRFGTVWRCTRCGKEWTFREWMGGDTPDWSRGAWHPRPSLNTKN